MGVLKAGSGDRRRQAKISSSFPQSILRLDEYKGMFATLAQTTKALFGQSRTGICCLELMPVGAAIAMANFRKKTGTTLSWPYRMRNI